mmetsp:Transcript_38091/g.94487  ORF Transcript_38091/g.94487 Transcript_38091/m.94487 type:complete len:508 (-) Transcript_38091:306-1829(-)
MASDRYSPGDSSQHDDGEKLGRKMQRTSKSAKCLVLVCINLSNLVCHSVYSVLASFFPQEARAKGMSDEPIGLVFAIFAAVVFVSAPFVSSALNTHGKRAVYVVGGLVVCVGTILFAFADRIQNVQMYFAWCFVLRCVQGFGAALEETAAYAIIAEIDPDAVSFNLGMTEISTGLGYMIGPTVGGFLFQAGGFALPFLCIGFALLPAMLLILWIVPDDRSNIRTSTAKDDAPSSTPMLQLLARPQILAIALTAIIGNTDYAFLEPTLAGHVESIAKSPQAIGMLFSVTSLTYTFSSPLMGWLSHKHRMGPRTVIIAGIAFQCLGFMLIGPSPLLPFGQSGEGPMSLNLLVFALFLFGLGESMSMTPLMEDMMLSCEGRKDDAINALSALMTSCFSLGQMVGPLIGSFMASRLGFNWASTGIGVACFIHTFVLMYLQRQSKPHQVSGYAWFTSLGAIAPLPNDWEGDRELAIADRGGESELAALNGDGSVSPYRALRSRSLSPSGLRR